MKVIKGTTITSKEFAEQFYNMQMERSANPEAWKGLRFLHPELDTLTGGIRRGEFVVIAGAQKAGKTIASLSWGLNFAKQLQENEQLLYVSLEMQLSSLAARVFSNVAHLDVTKFRDYEIKGDDWAKVKEATDKVSELNILWNEGAFNLAGVEAILKENPNIRLLIIDYFQLMSVEDNAKRYMELETLSRSLKIMANSHNITVIALSQQVREALTSFSKRKDPNTMAGTQALARDADMMIILLPIIKDTIEIPDMREIYVALSRNSAAQVGFESLFLPQYSLLGSPMKEIPKIQEVKHESWWQK